MKGHSLGEIASLINAELIGEREYIVSTVGSLKNATSDQISFFVNTRYQSDLEQTRAGAVILPRESVELCPVPCLVSKDPYSGYIKVAEFLNPEPEHKPGTHPSAVIQKSANIADSALIGANTYIGHHAEIKDNVQIGPGCVIEDYVIIEKDTRLRSNVTLCHHVTVGRRVILHPGVIVGSDGFGLANDNGRWLKIPQLGSVEIGDDVEIGANTAIDRGALENTRVEEGVKIDNLVQIGHNVIIGAHTAIAGCAVLAGSVIIGKRCMIGGGTAIAGHKTIADDVVITGLSGVTNSIKQPGIYSGSMTTTDNLTWRKNMVRLRHLDEIVRRLSELEDKLAKSGSTGKENG